jgi:hypothetical protein
MDAGNGRRSDAGTRAATSSGLRDVGRPAMGRSTHRHFNGRRQRRPVQPFFSQAGAALEPQRPHHEPDANGEDRSHHHGRHDDHCKLSPGQSPSIWRHGHGRCRSRRKSPARGGASIPCSRTPPWKGCPISMLPRICGVVDGRPPRFGRWQPFAVPAALPLAALLALGGLPNLAGPSKIGRASAQTD